jgi:hypothetical protein
MSSVGAPNGNNAYTAQTLWQRDKAQGGAGHGDGPSQTFGATAPQATNSPASNTAAVSSGKVAVFGGTFPRFDPVTMRTLLALQTAK